MSREQRFLVAGWITGVVGILSALGWATSQNAFLNLMLTGGTMVLAAVGWAAAGEGEE